MDNDAIILSRDVERLFAENPGHYKDSDVFLAAVRRRFGNPEFFASTKLLLPSGENAVDGELIRFRGMVQNAHAAEFYSSHYTVISKNGDEHLRTCAFSDVLQANEYDEYQIVSVGMPNATRMVYNVCPLPGESFWMKNRDDHESTASDTQVENVAKDLITGSELGGRYFLNALIAKTYSWRGEQVPLCSLPVAFLNVRDSRSIIDSIRFLMPLVHVLPITKKLIEEQCLFPVMDHDSGRLNGGCLQLARGSMLVLDFTNYVEAAVSTQNNYVERNKNALQTLIDEQVLLIDYGQGMHRLITDVRMIALVPPARGQFRAPLLDFHTIVPLKVAFSDGINPAHEMSLMDANSHNTFRWLLAQASERVEKVELSHDVQKGIVAHFTQIRERLNAAAPDHFRHLLSLTRLQTALWGDSHMLLPTFEQIMKSEFDRLTLLGLLNI